jgi:hypothetical protein
MELQVAFEVYTMNTRTAFLEPDSIAIKLQIQIQFYLLLKYCTTQSLPY